MAFRSQADGELLARAATDPRAFDEFYRRYEAIVLAFVRRRVRDAEVAADLTADVFVEVLLSAHGFRDDGKPALGWLLGIAANVIASERRRSATERRAFAKVGLEQVVHAPADLAAIDALLDELPQGSGPLESALEALPSDQREAVRAHVLDEVPYRELASVLGVKEGTVRQRVRRGLMTIRRTKAEVSP